VHEEYAGRSEPLFAERTGVRLLAGVDPPMHVQRRAVLVLFSTDRAGWSRSVLVFIASTFVPCRNSPVPRDAAVNAFMNNGGSLQSETPAALVACIRPLPI
jgi:hypothetical protein